MVAIATQDDGYTIIELLSEWDVEVGDEIIWAHGHRLGSEIYQNVTKKITGRGLRPKPFGASEPPFASN